MRLLPFIIFVLLAVPAAGQSDVGLLPDLTFRFTCKDLGAEALAAELTTFLRTSSFRSIDLAKIQAEHGLGIPHFQMEAIDQADHWIRISSAPRHPHAYGLSLFSTPPTKHSPGLESAFIEFVTTTMRCDAKDPVRHENGVEALGMFQRQRTRVEALLRDADEMNGNVRRSP